MATILAYTSPALGHLLPISALLSELSRRGHTVHVRTLSTGVEIGQRLGFTTDAIDPRIEGIEHDDWKATNPRAALKLSVAVFGRRAVHEVADLADAVARVHPDALLVDVNCWGALS
ncbi:MAG: glycosyltransferase, family, partial [Mycobacterium sp.]|nr:glycosyltransferase, family [Mycobacterium sp.]